MSNVQTIKRHASQPTNRQWLRAPLSKAFEVFHGPLSTHSASINAVLRPSFTSKPRHGTTKCLAANDMLLPACGACNGQLHRRSPQRPGLAPTILQHYTG